jgi:hypothetical protein
VLTDVRQASRPLFILDKRQPGVLTRIGVLLHLSIFAMTHQGATLPLLRGNTTLESALEQEEDVLLELDYPEQRIDFFVFLYSNRGDIERIAAYHLSLGPSDTCRTGDVNEWVHGSFNVCIPLYVNKQGQDLEKQALIRFPLPYRIGEFRNPGNVDEKLRCEAATFIWIHTHCPEIPIPQLWGFGLVGGQSVWDPNENCYHYMNSNGFSHSSRSRRISLWELDFSGLSKDLSNGY